MLLHKSFLAIQFTVFINSLVK